MPQTGTHRYRTIPEVAKELGISEAIIRSWIEQGLLKTHRNPNPSALEHVVVDTIEIIALVKSEGESDDLPDE